MPGLKERAKTLVELADGAAFLFAERPLSLDEKAAALLADAARPVLAGAQGGARGRRRSMDGRGAGGGGARLCDGREGSSSVRWRSRCALR